MSDKKILCVVFGGGAACALVAVCALLWFMRPPAPAAPTNITETQQVSPHQTAQSTPPLVSSAVASSDTAGTVSTGYDEYTAKKQLDDAVATGQAIAALITIVFFTLLIVGAFYLMRGAVRSGVRQANQRK